MMDQSASLAGLRYLVPEIALLGVAAAAMLTHLFVRKRGRRLAGFVSLAGFLAVTGLLVLSPRAAGRDSCPARLPPTGSPCSSS